MMAPSLAVALKATSIDDHDEILAAADAALKSSKNDILALQTRVVALLKLDRFDDVLRTVAAGGDNLKAQCAVETAYVYYKTGQLEEAAKLLGTIAFKSDAVKHLEGQVAYRDERFEDAWKIYSGFEDTNEDGDLIVNKIAVLAQLGWSGKGSDNYSADAESIVAFEVAFNLACFHISKGSLLKALQILQLARRLCDASDELTDDEKQSELVPIIVQQAYVYSRLGLHNKAQELQKLLVLTDDCGDDIKALAQVNSALLSSASVTNPFIAERQLEAPIAAAKKMKLFDFQSAALRQLQLVLDLSIQKFGGSQTIAEQKSKSGPTTSAAINGFAPIGVAASSWQSPQKALAAATALLASRPSDVGLALTVVQLASQTGHIGVAINHLEMLLKNLEEDDTDKASRVRFNPGVVAIAVSLYRLTGRDYTARSELAKAAEFWKKSPGASARSLLIEAGLELLHSNKEKDLKLASETFASLLGDSTQDSIAAAGLVAAIASADDKKVKSHISEIPSTKSLVRGLNPKTLLDAGVAVNSQLAGTKRPASAIFTAATAPSKKRRHRKLPANYEEGKQPDPERWLPLRDRTSYRPKGGKKGKKKTEALTQGGYVKGEETLELVGGAGAVKVEKVPQMAAASKKKKKGRK